MTWMLQRAVGPQVATAMTLFGQVVGAEEAVRTGLALRAVDGDHDALVAAAVVLAAPAAAAPRELVVSIKRSMRATWAMDDHDEATETELVAQLESMQGPAFAELLTAMRARISRSSSS
jgi:enoyl-CoA hydratase